MQILGYAFAAIYIAPGAGEALVYLVSNCTQSRKMNLLGFLCLLSFEFHTQPAMRFMHWSFCAPTCIWFIDYTPSRFFKLA